VTMADPQTGEAIDRGLALWFPAPASFTGEDVVELHIHGGRAVIVAMVDALASLSGLRPAEPGEFTRRAFENGKLDLTAAEGLADLVNAETEAQRRQALRQLGGALAQLYESWRAELIGALARVEAEIDFPEEGLPQNLIKAVQPLIVELRTKMETHLRDNRRGERLRDGYSVVILGAPNVGKSSLLNALARREAAIVATTAGTTRDVIEVHLDLAGLPVAVADTAGIRASTDPIEQEGIIRALARATQADLRLVLVEAMDWPAMSPATADLVDGNALVVVTKTDIRRFNGEREYRRRPIYPISTVTGDGVEDLVRGLEGIVQREFDGKAGPTLTRARHRAALEDCASALRRAEVPTATELLAEDLRLASRALGRITGRVDVEDVLDVVFAEFCIGK
jgi:tRNA modification GTPase